MILLWAGDEASYVSYEKALAKMEAADAEAKKKGEGDDWWAKYVEPMYTREGSVGVVHINGTLIQGEAGTGRMFGMVGYDDIKASLLEGLADKEAKSLILNVNSGGGQVAGVRDAMQFVQAVGSAKPVTAYAASLMASAATWVSLGAKKIVASETALVGNIGVIRIHAERSKQLEKEGVKVTVFKGGELKGAGNPYEELSAEAKKEIQSQVDDLYEMFVTDVAASREVSYPVADKKMSNGRTFLAHRALEAGLIDAVGSMADAVAESSKSIGSKLAGTKKGGGSANRAGIVTDAVDLLAGGLDNPSNSQGTCNMQLTPKQAAAVAAGIAIDAVKDKTDAEIDAMLAAAQTDELKDEAGKAAASKSEDEAADQSPTVEGLQADIVTLTAQLAEATKTVDEVGALKAQVEELTKQVLAANDATKSLQAMADSLAEVVSSQVSVMAVALNRKVESGKKPEEVLAQYKDMQAVYQSAFKVGGVADATPKAQEKQVAPNGLFLAALNGIVRK